MDKKLITILRKLLLLNWPYAAGLSVTLAILCAILLIWRITTQMTGRMLTFIITALSCLKY